MRLVCCGVHSCLHDAVQAHRGSVESHDWTLQADSTRGICLRQHQHGSRLGHRCASITNHLGAEDALEKEVGRELHIQPRSPVSPASLEAARTHKPNGKDMGV